MNPELNDFDLQGYAQYLMIEHAKDVEFLTVHEMAEEYWGSDFDGLTDGEANRVSEFISGAKVTVSFE